jgi:hypothetical protein
LYHYVYILLRGWGSMFNIIAQEHSQKPLSSVKTTILLFRVHFLFLFSK